MRAVGAAVLAVGMLMLAFGLFGEAMLPAPVPGAVPASGLARLAAPAAFVPAGAGLLVAGAVFFVGGALARRVADLEATLSRAQRALGQARPAPEGAPVSAFAGAPAAAAAPPQPAPAYTNDAAGWRRLIADAETRGWKAATTLTGVHFRNRQTGAEVHVRRIEEAVEGLGLHAPPPPPGPAPAAPQPGVTSIAGGRIAAPPGPRLGAI